MSNSLQVRSQLRGKLKPITIRQNSGAQEFALSSAFEIIQKQVIFCLFQYIDV